MLVLAFGCSSSISNDTVSFADTGASLGDRSKYFEPQHAESHGRGVCNDADDVGPLAM